MLECYVVQALQRPVLQPLLALTVGDKCSAALHIVHSNVPSCCCAIVGALMAAGGAAHPLKRSGCAHLVAALAYRGALTVCTSFDNVYSPVLAVCWCCAHPQILLAGAASLP